LGANPLAHSSVQMCFDVVNKDVAEAKRQPLFTFGQ